MKHEKTLAGAAILAALTVAGCGSANNGALGISSTRATPSKTAHLPRWHRVDTARLQRAIAAVAQAQRKQTVSVLCPPEVKALTGTSFYCAAQQAGVVTPFRVTVHAGGKLTYRGVNPATTPSVDMTTIEIEVALAVKRHHQIARSVLCPAEMPRQTGLVFTCSVTTGAGPRTIFIVRETNGAGDVALSAR